MTFWVLNMTFCGFAFEADVASNVATNHQTFSSAQPICRIFVPLQARNDFQPRITRIDTNIIPRKLGIIGVAALNVEP